MKKNTYLWILFIIFISYSITTYINTGISDILSPIHNVTAGVLIFIFLKDIRHFRVSWGLIAVLVMVWGFTDAHWAYYVFFTVTDPNEQSFFMYFYLIPNVLLFLAAGYYFMKNMVKWYKLQLMIDSLLVAFIVLGMGSALFYNKIDFSLITMSDFVSLILYSVTDIMTLTLILVMVSSSRYSHLTKAMRYITLGYLLYITADILYIDSYLSDGYVPNSVSDIMFLLSFLMMTVAAYHASKDENNYAQTIIDQTPLNFGKSKVIWWVLIIPIIFYMFDKISIKHIAVFFFVMLLYLLFNHYVQKSMMTELLYNKEKKMKTELEKIIKERTHELLISKEAFERKAVTDSLTGVFNRDYFLDQVKQKVTNREVFSIISIDLNRFKVINDLYGHDMGDEIIKNVAKRLSGYVNIKSDLCRTGGDVFSIISYSSETCDLENISKRLIEIVGETMYIGNYQFAVDACIGVARYPSDADTAVALVRGANIAMHQAKTLLSENKHLMYSAHLIERLERRSHIEMLLKNANYDEEFSLHYQPQFDAKTKDLYAMEALIRWQHPEEGFISPAEFIPIAEEIGLILNISDWVFKNSMIQIKEWNHDFNKKLVMGINLSPISVSAVNFFPKLKKLIKEVGVEPWMLDFEITEHSAMNTSSIMEELFVALSGLGVNVSIDDFGTGYSSLSYIKRFNVDTLKIAKELVDNIVTEFDDQLIVKAIIMMAKGMGLKTIAEGVETKEQLDILIEMECDSIQGYYLGKPMTAQSFETNFLVNTK